MAKLICFHEQWKVPAKSLADREPRLPEPDTPKVGQAELTLMCSRIDKILQGNIYKNVTEEHKAAFKEAAPEVLGMAYGVYMARQIQKVRGAPKGTWRLHDAMKITAFEALVHTGRFGAFGPNAEVWSHFQNMLETCANHCVFSMSQTSLEEA